MIGRWLKFNTVGMAGTVVQLGVLWFCTHALGMPYLAATILAVEIALLQNFALHEAWTWAGMPLQGRYRRLLRFHAANGIVSIVSNTLFTWLFKEHFGLPLLAANLAAITVTALLNFALASAWVFPETVARPVAAGRLPRQPSASI